MKKRAGDVAMAVDSVMRHVDYLRAEMSNRKAAESIGINPSTLSRIDCGGVPDLETFLKLKKWDPYGNQGRLA